MKYKAIAISLFLFFIGLICAIPGRAQSTGHSVTLTWTPSEQPGGETVSSWNVYRSLASAASYALVSNVPFGSLAFTDGGVESATSYSYVVTALDTAGVESAYSPSVTATIPANVSLLTITTTSLPSGTVGANFNATLTVSGGTPPYTWTGSGVAGLLVSGAGSITGVPVLSGSFNETVMVTDSLGTTANVTLPVNVAALAPTTPSVPAVTFPSGMALYWTLNSPDISNGMIADNSGNGNSGILIGNLPPAPGQINQALSFDGSTSYVLVGGGVGSLTQSLTLAAWINTTNATRTEAIMGRFDASGSAAGFIFSTDQNGNLDLRIGGADLAAYPNYITDPTVVNNGKWHLVVATISFELQTVNFYVDGILTSSTPVNIVPNGNGGSAFEVGTNSWTDYGNFFTGSVDTVQVYNRALSGGEVNAIFQLTSGVQQ